jgi:hypothetical protein
MAFKLTYSDGHESDYDDDTKWEVEDGVLKLGKEAGKWTVFLSPSHWATLELAAGKSGDKDGDSDKGKDRDEDKDEDKGKSDKSDKSDKDEKDEDEDGKDDKADKDKKDDDKDKKDDDKDS